MSIRLNWIFVGKESLSQWITFCDRIDGTNGIHNIRFTQWKKSFSFNWSPDYNSSKELGFKLNKKKFNGGFKFSFFNIYSNYIADDCNTTGDIYAWNVSDWSYDSNVDSSIYTHDFFFEELCYGKNLLEIFLPFDKTIFFHKIIGNVRMMDIVGSQNSNKKNLVPYTYVNGSYINLYSDQTFTYFYHNGLYEKISSSQEFNHSLFYSGEPNSEEENCVACYHVCQDLHCSQYPVRSFFQLSKGTQFTLRYIYLKLIKKAGSSTHIILSLEAWIQT